MNAGTLMRKVFRVQEVAVVGFEGKGVCGSTQAGLVKGETVVVVIGSVAQRGIAPWSLMVCKVECGR